ncbi:hypothetical protein DdX_00289 [Ditylenchus destructor]|uniref:Uncharacterized protein n=1 Tax=Ditylenchus destructor TaxID=166010 RepID=A0AAD4RA82_9BILA|nr:hypothetical protein DdX_00289 [Ditylenchus destructor]
MLCTALFLRKIYGGNFSERLNNRVVKITLITELLLSYIPNVFTTIFNAINGEPISNYLGPYPPVLTCIDAALCSILYFRAMYSRAKQRSNQVDSYRGPNSRTNVTTSQRMFVTGSG